MTVNAWWSRRIQRSWPVGTIAGLWARSPKIEAFAVGRGLDGAIPLGALEANWESGLAGDAIRRWAPEILSRE